MTKCYLNTSSDEYQQISNLLPCGQVLGVRYEAEKSQDDYYFFLSNGTNYVIKICN